MTGKVQYAQGVRPNDGLGSSSARLFLSLVARQDCERLQFSGKSRRAYQKFVTGSYS